ncbi:hypothetical protein TSOC_000811 [Tetrabaena socialis]|uniref:Uncharacterized protein n=1 Tax=Tetrabaena socialis TaxID=47790 RepID=A0A2J8AIH7_9CHLO|nr:hypothetical protein TSOC_000811 [Tetrabaena socialis]|eukprot:PNH12317.1 hypothetical protein TSOC_000811 [Tetrabaena socialis]
MAAAGVKAALQDASYADFDERRYDDSEFNVPYSLSGTENVSQEDVPSPSPARSTPNGSGPPQPTPAGGSAAASGDDGAASIPQQGHAQQGPYEPRTMPNQGAPLRQQRSAPHLRSPLPASYGAAAFTAAAPPPPTPPSAANPALRRAAAPAFPAAGAPTVLRAAFTPGQPAATRAWARRPPAAAPGARILPAKLTSILRIASTVSGLEGCIARWGGDFNFRHVSCCLNRLAKAADVFAPEQQPRVQQLLGRLDSMLLQHVGDCTARELCNALWVWAKLAHVPAPATWEAVRSALFGAGGDADAGPGANTPPGTPAAGAQALAGAHGVQGGGGGGAGAPQPSRAAAAGTAAAPSPSPPHAGLIASTNPQGLVNAAWALAKLGCADALAWRRLSRHALATIDGFSPYDISNLAYALVSARQQDATPAAHALMTALASAAVQRIDMFCPQDLANILWAYARAELPQPALFAAAAPAVRQTLPGFSHAGVAQVMWAFATLRVNDMALLAAMAREMQPRLQTMDSRNLSLIAWSLARVAVAGTAGSAATLRAAAAGREGAGCERSIRASLASRVPGHCSGGGGLAAGAPAAAAVAAAAVAGGDGGSGREDVLVAGDGESGGGGGGVFAPWAAREAMAGIMDLELPADLDEAIVVANVAAVVRGAHSNKLPYGSAASAAAALPGVEASAAAGAAAVEAARAQLPPSFLPALSDTLLGRLHSLESRYLTVVLWSMATLGHPDARLFEAAAAVLTRRLREADPAGFAPPGVAHTAWSYAAVRHYDAGLYDALGEAALRMARAAAAAAPGALPATEVSLSLANVLWALGSAGHYHPELFREAPRVVLAAVAAHAECANQLALVMLGCAYTRHPDAEVYGELAGLMRVLGPRAFSDASLSNICWSLAMVDHRDLPLLAELFSDLAARRADTFGARGCTQLFQCCMWLQAPKDCLLG